MCRRGRKERTVNGSDGAHMGDADYAFGVDCRHFLHTEADFGKDQHAASLWAVDSGGGQGRLCPCLSGQVLSA